MEALFSTPLGGVALGVFFIGAAYTFGMFLEILCLVLDLTSRVVQSAIEIGKYYLVD
jgi:hypothetical protein